MNQTQIFKREQMENNPDLSSATGFDFTKIMSSLNITTGENNIKENDTVLQENKARIKKSSILRNTNQILSKTQPVHNFVKKVNPLKRTFKNPLKLQYNLSNDVKIEEDQQGRKSSNLKSNILDKNLWESKGKNFQNQQQQSKNQEVEFAQKLLFTKDSSLFQEKIHTEFVEKKNSRRAHNHTVHNNVTIKPAININNLIKPPTNKKRSASVRLRTHQVQKDKRKNLQRKKSPLIKTKKPQIISPRNELKNIMKKMKNENPYDLPFDTPEVKKGKLKFHEEQERSRSKGKNSETESRFSRRFIFDDNIEELDDMKSVKLVGKQKDDKDISISQDLRSFISKETSFKGRFSEGVNPFKNKIDSKKKFSSNFEGGKPSRNTFEINKSSENDDGDKSITSALKVLQKNFELREIELTREFSTKEKSLNKRIEELEMKNRNLFDKKMEVEEKLRTQMKKNLIDLTKKEEINRNQEIEVRLKEENEKLKIENQNLLTENKIFLQEKNGLFEEVQRLKNRNSFLKNKIDFFEQKNFESEKSTGLIEELRERVQTLELLKVSFFK